MSDKKKVLQGYQKVGSKFVSPINNLPQIRSLSYVDFLLPELIWIGLINDHLGYVRAARFLEEIFSIIDSVAYGEDVEEDLDEASKDPYGNFAYI